MVNRIDLGGGKAAVTGDGRPPGAAPEMRNSGSRQTLLRIGTLVPIAAAVGLPIIGFATFMLAVAAAVVVFTGVVRRGGWRWLAACALVAAVIAARLLFPLPLIEEGHNAFLPPPPATSIPGLPSQVQAFLSQRFEEEYPAARRCDDQSRGCWRPDRSSAEDGFALSADALLDRPAFSRRVTGIDFSDPVHARFGFINDIIYNWIPDATDIERFRRDRRSLNLLDRFRVTFPLFVMYRFPASFVGSVLCWRGEVMWETAPDRFDVFSSADTTCRTLTAADVNRRIFGISVKRTLPLAMRLDPNWSVRAHGLLDSALRLAAVAAVLVLLVQMQSRRLVFPAVVVGLSILVAALVDLTFLGGFRPLDSGDDGFMYEGYARNMIRHLFNGEFADVLRGEESIYYFTPGIRYFRMIERFLFGDTNLGYLGLVLGFPFMVHALGRRFLPAAWATVIVLVFVATPLGVVFGSAYLQYAKWAARGFADPCAHVLLIAGMVLAIRPPDDRRIGRAFAAGLLLATAIFVRPNLLLTSGVMIVGAIAFAIHGRNMPRAAALLLGFAALALSPLHNWVFAHSLVPFSDNVDDSRTLVMPPHAYLAALLDLVRLDFTSDAVARAFHQIADWLSGPSGIAVFIPLQLAALAVLVRVGLFGSRFDPWLRLIALATLLQQGTAICYVSSERYHLSMWLLMALVAIVWLREEGLAWFDRRHPTLRARWSAHPMFASATRAIAALRPAGA